MGQTSSRGSGASRRKSLHDERYESHVQSRLEEALSENRLSNDFSGMGAIDEQDLLKAYPILDDYAKFVATSFNVEYCMIALVSQKGDSLVKATIGLEDESRNIILVFEKNDCVFYDDVSSDIKLWRHPAVIKSPFVKFYAGAPLHACIYSRGSHPAKESYFVGHLCVGDSYPKTFTHDQKNKFMGIAAILSHYISQFVQHKCCPEEVSIFNASKQNNPFTPISMNYSSMGYLIVDVSQLGWPILYFNNRWQSKTQLLEGSSLLSHLQIVRSSHIHILPIINDHQEQLEKTDVSCLHTSDDVQIPEHFSLEVENKIASWGLTALDFNRMFIDTEHIDRWASQLRRQNLTSKTPPMRLYSCTIEFGQESKINIENPFADIHFLSFIGKGSFGSVYCAKWHSKYIAIKCVEILHDDDLQTCKEVQFGISLEHAHIVKTFDYRQLNNKVWILIELCHGGTLSQAIARSQIPLDAIFNIISSIASGMSYLHSKNIIHADLSTNNILMTYDMKPKISDFGLSRALINPSTNTSTHGTVSFMPPELFKQRLLTKSADVYSFGVILFEILSGHRAYAGLREPQILYEKMYGNENHFNLPSSCPQHYKDLLTVCLHSNHTLRPTFDEILTRLIVLKNTNIDT